jgi:putative FmdB family regulatory protein
MPIYEYRCADCGFQNEYLQKVSEPPMTLCPACGKEAFRKLLTAAGFQLKGSGWYVKPEGGKPEGANGGESTSESKSESKSEASSDKGAASASAAG